MDLVWLLELTGYRILHFSGKRVGYHCWLMARIYLALTTPFATLTESGVLIENRLAIQTYDT